MSAGRVHGLHGVVHIIGGGRHGHVWPRVVTLALGPSLDHGPPVEAHEAEDHDEGAVENCIPRNDFS